MIRAVIRAAHPGAADLPASQVGYHESYIAGAPSPEPSQ